MRFLRRLIDKARTLAGVRKVRQIPAMGDKPPVGSSVVRERLRMRLKYPIDDAFWQWLSAKGWRAMQVRNNRRRYVVVAEKTLIKMMRADLDIREQMHERITRADGLHAKGRQTSGD